MAWASLQKTLRNEGMTALTIRIYRHGDLWAHKDYLWMMDFAEELIEKVAST